MATVKLKFRASSVEGKEGTLYYHLIHQRASRWIRTEHRIYPEEWNEKKACIGTSMRPGRQTCVSLVRAKVHWEMQQMQRVLHDMAIAGTSCDIDDLMAKLRLLPSCQSVFTFMERQVAMKDSMQRIGTRNNYLNAYRRFKEYLNGEDLTFAQITAGMIEQYAAWLTSRGIKQNTIAYYLRTLRTLCNKAVEAGLAPRQILFAKVPTCNVRTCKRAITIMDIRNIEQLPLHEGSSSALARDLFLFSFYLRGMAFVDMAYLKKSDLKYGMLSYSRRKTNQSKTIEWERPMQTIVDRYASLTNGSPYMLPILTGADDAPYARYKQVEQSVNRHLKKIGEMVGLKMPLTTYVARHTWASVALQMDISIATISEGMGHSSYKTTQIYLETIDMSTVNQANKKILKSVLTM